MSQHSLTHTRQGKPVSLAGCDTSPVPLALRARLKNRLLAADSVAELMQGFYETVREYIALDGMSYRNDAVDLYWSAGLPGTHKANYRLNSASGDHGTLVFARSHDRFGEGELEKLEALMGTLVYPLKIVTLLQRSGAATSDARRGRPGDERLHKQLTQRCEQATGLDAVLLVEIDRFEFLQQELGTATAEDLGKLVQKRIRTCLQDQDQVFMLGGRQMAVLLGNARRQRACLTAELLLLKLERNPFTLPDCKAAISASIGMAMIEAEDSPCKVLDRAEIGLMMARHSGGAQMRFVDTGPIESATPPAEGESAALAAG